MKFFEAILTANSYLYFYSTEFLKTTTVNRILHNWALMFALNDIKANPEKKHLENLQNVNFYCSPAVPRKIDTQSFLLNPIPESTGAGKLGIMRIEKFVPGSEFEFIVMSKNNKMPPELISYGKKKTHHSVQYKEINKKAEHKEQISLQNQFVNPLDFKKIENLQNAKKYPMKPSPLYLIEKATFQDIFLLSDNHSQQRVFPANFPYSEWIR